MPRFPHSLLRQARAIDPLVQLLLRETRDISAAQSELRWIKQHVRRAQSYANQELERQGFEASEAFKTKFDSGRLIRDLCVDRSRGKPLAYILGSQPFGSLDILCAPGVLCPRPETEHAMHQLASLLKRNFKSTQDKSLKILDLCTGPGSIALLLTSLLNDTTPHKILGLDISLKALQLAQSSLDHNINAGLLQEGSPVAFRAADALVHDENFEDAIYEELGTKDINSTPTIDLIVSNPPYVSPRGFWRECGRSVRLYEPRLALVPPEGSGEETGVRQEDAFYPHIDILGRGYSSKGLVVEVGGWEQARQVAEMWKRDDYWETGIWEDDAGHGRIVTAWRKEATGGEKWEWLFSP